MREQSFAEAAALEPTAILLYDMEQRRLSEDARKGVWRWEQLPVEIRVDYRCRAYRMVAEATMPNNQFIKGK